MWLFAYGPAVLGVLFYRRWAFWRWVVVMFAWQAAAAFLFAAHGTPDHPQGDGLIFAAMRRATNDGPELALFGTVFLVVFYGGAAIFLNAMRLAARTPRLSEGEDAEVSKGRKALELAGLTVALFAMFFLSPRQARPEPPRTSAELGAMLDEVATTLNADLPKPLDEMTTLVSVSRTGLTLTYDYKIALPRPEPEIFADAFRQEKAPDICRVQRRGLSAGLSYRYRYVFASDPRPLDFLVDRAACTGSQG